jgi:hypothetical protein
LPHEGIDSLDSRPAVRRISAARSDAQTRQQRGQPIAQDARPCPAKNWTDESPRLAGADFKTRVRMQSGLRPRLRSASIDYGASNQPRPTEASALRWFVIDVWRRVIVTKGRAARMRKHSNRPVLLGSDFARRTCCKPSRPVLVASPPCCRVTHRVEGGSQPKGPG